MHPSQLLADFDRARFLADEAWRDHLDRVAADSIPSDADILDDDPAVDPCDLKDLNR
jgi:hypothetical protein